MTPEDRDHNGPPNVLPRDQAAFSERLPYWPPYWAGCERMRFDQLTEFILDAVRRLDNGSAVDLPGTKEEFLDLWELLRKRYASPEAKMEHPASAPPTKFLTDAEKRSAKYARYWRLVEQADELRNLPSKKNKKKWQLLREMEKKIVKVQEEIAELRGSIDDRSSYLLPQHRSSYLPEPDEPEPDEPELDKNAPVPIPGTLSDPRYRSLMEVRGVIASAFDPNGGPTERLSWRLLPPGETSADIRCRYEGLLRRGALSGFDQDRLDKALSLPWKKSYIGRDGFDGYIIFTFHHTSKALMECPIKNNAIYVIGSDWQRWSKMNKQQLRADRSGDVVKINHRGDWFSRLKKTLDLS